MKDEGYIKFTPHWVKSTPFPQEWLLSLLEARQKLFQANLIGAYPSGIGFGNISIRKTWKSNPNSFLISGSATGHIPTLTNEHFSLVTKVNIEQNSLHCEGPVIASSESMSHAVIYRQCPQVQAVIHVHHLEMWQHLLHKVPTTDAAATYGTPEMANSIVELLKKTDLRDTRLFVMQGHEEGVFAFGNDMEQALGIIMNVNKGLNPLRGSFAFS